MKGCVIMQNAMQERATLTVKEAAQFIGVSPPTMYEITRRADFTGLIRVGVTNRRKLILKSGLMKWLENQAGLVGN